MRKTAVSLLATILLLSGCSSNEQGSVTTPNSSADQNQETVSNVNDSDTENTVEPTPESTVEPQIEAYEPGTYKIGVDMPAGDYMLINTGQSAYYAICSDPNGDDIINNDNFNYNSIITVIDGDYLELSRCNAFSLDEFNNQIELNTDGEGMFLVGTHIPAGEYKIEVTSEGNHGYYAILNDTREGDIQSNDNFEGSRYIEVSEGDILELSRCRLVK